jgi:hypothetical protein
VADGDNANGVHRSAQSRVDGDWPDKVIADPAAAKVQLLFSRVHSGNKWDGLGWKAWRTGGPLQSQAGHRTIGNLMNRQRVTTP